jgi:hypothetical protein
MNGGTRREKLIVLSDAELTLEELHAVSGSGKQLRGIYDRINEYSHTLQSQDKLGNTQIQQ